MAQNFTDRHIKSLLKEGRAARHAVGNGLYFRLSQEGTGFWVVRYVMHGKRREFTLGRYPDISLADATAEALRIKAEVKRGVDPLAERQRADKTEFNAVDDLAADWLRDCEKRLKHPGIPRRIYEKDIAPWIGSLAIDQVSPRDIRALISKVADSGRPTIANDALMYCKQLFRQGVKLDLIRHNPAEPFNVSDAGGVEESRSRALSVEELKTVFAAFHRYSDQFSRENTLASALLLALGVRKGELVAARWEEFESDKQLWHIPEERSKTGKAITIPLSDTAMQWFQELHIHANGSDFVFPNRRASKRFGHVSPDTLNAAIKKLHGEGKLGVEYFSVHDLRRTFRSLLSSLGVPGHIAERCLNHKLKGVEGIYDRYDYLDERREALGLVAGVVAPLMDDGRVPLLR